MNRITAVFDDIMQAGQAISALRQMGVTDADLSIVSNESHAKSGDHAGHDKGDNMAKGALTGAGVGALFGLTALAIPGVGPFITAGFLADALGVTGGAVAAGALVGGTSGAIANAFTRAGYDEHEAKFYGSAVERGGVALVVNASGGTAQAAQIAAALSQAGGRSASAL